MTIREHDDVVGFQQAAARFCHLLEADPCDPEQWVVEILSALAKLYACGHSLPDLGLPEDAVHPPDTLDVTQAEWRKVYSLVSRVLGNQTGYWAYFDPSEPRYGAAELVFADLADDLADIFRDVKPGLRAWETGEDAYLPSLVFDWKFPLFGSHWGVHAVSAMRALHPIAYLRGLQQKAEQGASADGGRDTGSS